ncbi:MAG: Y-family DNA polymerase [Bacillota bacterium]
MQWICSVEIQGLYAAAARAAGLAEEGRPVVVVRNGRVFDGCREAFAAGLLLGSPVHQVLRDVPRAVQLDWTEIDASRRARSWWDECLGHTPYLEPGEPHQLLLALPTPEAGVTKALRAEVNQLAERAATYGFVAFVGVGSSRLVARAAMLACKEGYLLRRPGMAGRSGGERVAIVPLGEEERFLAPLPLAYLPSPPEVKRRIARLGLRTVGEAARVPEGEWVRQLGPQGRQLWLWSRGIDPEPVRPAYPPRRLTRRIEFQGEVRERDLLERELNRAAQPLVKQLALRGEGCQLVALVLELAGGEALHVERVLPKLQQSAFPIQQGLQTLLGQLLDGREELEATAVTAEVGLIGPMPWQQMDLWEDRLLRERRERLEQALALLHERFPGRVIGLGPRSEPSWREQMLQYADPYRWSTRGA